MVFCLGFLNSNLSSLGECDFLDMRSVVCAPLIKGYVLCGTGCFPYLPPGHVAYSFHPRLNYCCDTTFLVEVTDEV